MRRSYLGYITTIVQLVWFLLGNLGWFGLFWLKLIIHDVYIYILILALII
jgi:hypothetical protein